MTPHAQQLVERYISGGASAADERALAQLALEDDEIFELLATIGLGREAMGGEIAAAGERPVAVLPPPRTSRAGWAWLAAAAVLTIALAQLATRGSDGPATDGGDEASRTPPGPPPQMAEIRIPAFLATNLEIPVVTAPPATFRSAGSARQLPSPTGRIVSVDGYGGAIVDVGAIDGLAQGLSILVEPDPETGAPGTTAAVAAVFRDQARLKVDATVSPGRRVRLEPSTHLAALSTAIAEAGASGDAQALRDAATRATGVVQSDGAPADVRRRVLTQLAALARSRNDVVAALGYLQAAADLAATAPAAPAEERAAILNAIGTITAGSGSLTEAERHLQQARAIAPPDHPATAQVLNNLGAIAALRGDRAGARRWYESALALLSDGRNVRDRDIVSANLGLTEGVR